MSAPRRDQSTSSLEAADGSAREGRLPVEDSRLVPWPPRYSFDRLLDGIKPDNQHEDLFDGTPIGTETW
jgi:hypothetical protein